MATDDLAVGVIFPAKKIEHLRDLLHEVKDGVRFVLIDLYDASVTSAQSIAHKYGKLDAVLHKLAHEMVFARLGDPDASQRLALMHEYVAQNPSVKIIDPTASVQLLTDRHEACEMLVRLQQEKKSEKDHHHVAFSVPKFHVIRSREQFDALCAAVDSEETKLPLICKSVEACACLPMFRMVIVSATDRSHLMNVVTQRSDLVYVEYPTLYQEFINHSSRLFKGYVLGDLINVAERRSLPNLNAGAAQVHFNTQKQYPTAEDFHPETAVSSRPSTTSASGASTEHANTTVAVRSQSEIFAAVRAIGERIREELSLTLFGFDVIVSDATQELFVIDVNYFPSYKELDDFSSTLRKHIKQRCTGP